MCRVSGGVFASKLVVHMLVIRFRESSLMTLSLYYCTTIKDLGFLFRNYLYMHVLSNHPD